jgi:carboxypeptidase C (cathepsin A)
MTGKILYFSLFLFLVRGLMAEPVLAKGEHANPSLPTEKRTAQTASKGPSREEPSVTHHSIKVKGRMINYTATAGYIPLRDERGNVKAGMFFVAYVQDSQGDKSSRPVTFAYNGGPGASSVWLHLAALGPKRVVLTEEGKALPPPYQLAINQYTWLEFTDLVFVDPVGTGYSRPAPGVKAKEFFGVEEDIHSMAEFIRLYATRYERTGYLIFCH